MIVTAEELKAIREHAVREYPRESCGVIVVRGAGRRVVPCRNEQDELHARDPLKYSRDARTAYYIHHDDLIALGKLEVQGFSYAVIYHSHVDVGAYFSPTDKRNALMGDEPAYPGVTYVVTSVVDRRAEATAAFRWDPVAKDFLEVELTVTSAVASAERNHE